jgi:hypothetical protein
LYNIPSNLVGCNELNFDDTTTTTTTPTTTTPISTPTSPFPTPMIYEDPSWIFDGSPSPSEPTDSEY